MYNLEVLTKKPGCSAEVSAFVLETKGREFKSHHPDQIESKVLVNIEKYGNTTSATLPLLLNDFEHLFKKGDNIIFAAFGGGFTWGSIYLKWAYNKQ